MCGSGTEDIALLAANLITIRGGCVWGAARMVQKRDEEPFCVSPDFVEVIIAIVVSIAKEKQLVILCILLLSKTSHNKIQWQSSLKQRSMSVCVISLF